MEEYAKIIHIEALTLIDMLGKLIVPACAAYSKQLAEGRGRQGGHRRGRAPAEAAQVRLLTEKAAEADRADGAAPRPLSPPRAGGAPSARDV